MEPAFNLSYYSAIDWNTYYNWPITYKRWWMKRLNTELERARNAGQSDLVSKAPHNNDPQTRQLQGKRPFVPHALKR